MSEMYADSYRDFLTYTKGLEMTVLHDEGLYRHLKFKDATGWFGYTLVTWPGHLYVGGGLDAFTFARIPDMFSFFTSGVSGVEPGRINPSYWAEKITAAATPARCHSPEKFRSAVVQDFLAARHRFPIALPFWEQVRDDLLNDDVPDYEEHARAAVDRFDYYDLDTRRHFQFSDWWEWDTKDWSVHYLRACHAIVWGINQYRAAVAEKAVIAA
jgi:hypothetical protein